MAHDFGVARAWEKGELVGVELIETGEGRCAQCGKSDQHSIRVTLNMYVAFCTYTDSRNNQCGRPCGGYGRPPDGPSRCAKHREAA